MAEDSGSRRSTGVRFWRLRFSLLEDGLEEEKIAGKLLGSPPKIETWPEKLMCQKPNVIEGHFVVDAFGDLY